jgi:hypothetical protein
MDTRRLILTRWCGAFACGLAAALVVGGGNQLEAQQRRNARVELPRPADAPRKTTVIPPTNRAPADYKSVHFLIHTDLPPSDARKLVTRLETMLALISKYWGQKLNGTIECYVVADLANWPEGSLEAVPGEDRRGPASLVETLNRGKQTLAAKAVVYAFAGRGRRCTRRSTPCGRLPASTAVVRRRYGRTGQYWRPETPASRAQTICWPTATRRRCRSARSCRKAKLFDRVSRLPPARLRRTIPALGATLLEHNPNYNDRFRPLGLGYLADQPVSFAETIGRCWPSWRSNIGSREPRRQRLPR